MHGIEHEITHIYQFTISFLHGLLRYRKETDGFIKWINATYCKNLEKTFVIARNTKYDASLKTVEF